jgi:tRNA(fMet)-specific endonuclease VapC
VSYLLDTNVAIHLRDRDPRVMDRVEALEEPVMISIITRVELEGGVRQGAANAAIRKERLHAMLATLPTIPFGDEAADAYSAILEAVGFSRRKVLDRMIAAQALTQRAAVVTMNPDDFTDVPGLKVIAW